MKLQFHTRDTAWAMKQVVNKTEGQNTYWILTLTKKQRIRSLSQNEYYFAVIVKLFSEYTGYDKEESHQYLAGRFLSYQKDSSTFVKSTAKLSTLEFEQYLEQCRVYMWHEFQLHVPMPNEVTNDMLLEP